MNSRRKLKEALNEDRDIEIMRFIHTLMSNIPSRILNDKELKIYDLKTMRNHGTLKEYISERMMALFGVIVEYRINEGIGRGNQHEEMEIGVP